MVPLAGIAPAVNALSVGTMDEKDREREFLKFCNIPINTEFQACFIHK